MLLADLSRRAFLQPDDIFVVGRGDLIRNQAAFDQRWHGPIVEPAFDLGMTVGEGEAARPIVITGWKIVEPGMPGLIRPASHVGRKIADIDAVLAHVQQDKRARRSWIDHLVGLQINSP